MEYKVIYTFGSAKRFEEEVNKAIKEGWRPLGGLSINKDWFAQAMVKG